MDKSNNVGWECFIREFVPPLADPLGEECFIREFVPPPADPSWDVKECFIREFVLPPAHPSWDIGTVLFLSLFPHRLTPRGT